MFIVKHRKIFYIISVVLAVGSIVAISIWGLKPGIDFTGGSLLDVTFSGSRPTITEVQQTLTALGFGDASVRTSENGFIIRTKEITLDQKNSILQGLSEGGLSAQAGKYMPVEKTFSSVGPILGGEAIHKSWLSVLFVLLAIVLFITFAFRKVSRPVSSWVYGIVTVLALAHDVLVPAGVASVLGHFRGFEVDTLFVTALLVILGFSVHDTIVVFDRVRENLKNNDAERQGKPFDEVVGNSIRETFVRSINTSFTTMLAVFVLYLIGPETVRNFSLILLVGIFIGTYSSIFVGSTLLVTINNRKNK